MTFKKYAKLLTEVELEIMQCVWALGECNVREVQERLVAHRELAYTSVATMMKILEQKGVLKSMKKERTHLYRAQITREVYEVRALQHVQNSLFHGSPSSMVMRLLDESSLTSDEVKALQKLLKEKSRPS